MLIFMDLGSLGNGPELGWVRGCVTGTLRAVALGGRGCPRLSCDGGYRSPRPTPESPDRRCSPGEREAESGTSAWTVTLGRRIPQGALALGVFALLS